MSYLCCWSPLPKHPTHCLSVDYNHPHLQVMSVQVKLAAHTSTIPNSCSRWAATLDVPPFLCKLQFRTRAGVAAAACFIHLLPPPPPPTLPTTGTHTHRRSPIPPLGPPSCQPHSRPACLAISVIAAAACRILLRHPSCQSLLCLSPLAPSLVVLAPTPLSYCPLRPPLPHPVCKTYTYFPNSVLESLLECIFIALHPPCNPLLTPPAALLP
jgi:hypothetical protein